MEMATVSVRYIVDDVDAAIAFYTRHLGFAEVMHPAPTFAMLSRGDLRLLLSAPSGELRRKLNPEEMRRVLKLRWRDCV